MFELVLYFLPVPSFCLAMLAWQQIFVQTLHPAFRTDKRPPKQTNTETKKHRKQGKKRNNKNEQATNQPTNPPNQVSKLYITFF